MKKLIIAIDGPAAAGKSSVAKLLAERLNYLYIDTGAMYRCITLLVLKNKVDVENEDEIAKLLKDCNLSVSKSFFILNGEDVTHEIRSKKVSDNVSVVCAHPKVRMEMVNKQRELAKDGGVVLDGRDIGTFVFPNADVKIYQTANTETRSLRRYQENRAKGIDTSLEEVMQDIIKRDKMDSTRLLAPLMKAEDAVLIDTSSMNTEQTVNKIIDIIKAKTGEEFDD